MVLETRERIRDGEESDVQKSLLSELERASTTGTACDHRILGRESTDTNQRDR